MSQLVTLTRIISLKSLSVFSKVASHAYHLVRLAQEKAETQDKIDELLKRLAVEETELEGLQSAVALMKNSNVKYRSDAFQTNDGGGGEELRVLKDQARNAAN